MGKQTPFEKLKSDIPVMGYVPSQSYAESTQQLEESDYFLQNFKTPEDIDQYRNYILDSQFQELGVPSPFKSAGDFRADYDTSTDVPQDVEAFNIYKSVYPDKVKDFGVNPYVPQAGDTPEQALFREIGLNIKANKGKLPVASFIEKAVNNSMTAGWAKLFGDNMFDFRGGLTDLTMLEDGITYKGKKLNLTNDQASILYDYNNKITGMSQDTSFVEDVANIATSLVFDMPLLFLSGSIAGGVMKANTVTSALAKSTQYLQRLTGQVIQQGMNFNILGLPQTVENTRQNGLGGMLSSVFHNVTTGSLAAFTGTNGVALGKATGKFFLKNNPAIREEFGGLLGSVGFGYTVGKMEGMEDEDAVAQGLAFAATHFTNPTSYKRVITEMKNKNVRIYSESLKNHRDTGMLPDYFVEKDGKYQKIETDAFKREGRIVPMDVEPIEATSGNKADYIPINSMADLTQVKFKDALMMDRNEKNGKKLYDKWTKDLDPEYVKDNADNIRSLAEITSASLVGAKLGQVFGKWKLPVDAKFDDKVIKLSKEYSLSYADVKNFVLENANEYFRNPDDFFEVLDNNPVMVKELNDVMMAFGKAAVTIAKSNYAKELLSKSGLPASRQIAMGDPPKPVDLKTEAERIAEGVRRTDLKKQAVDGTLPTTELKPDKYVFYDFNGELVPMVKSKGKLTIAGTNIEIPFETVKDKVKTKAQVTKEIKEKASKKTETKEVKADDNETAYVKQALVDAGGASKLSPDKMLEVVRKAREEYKAKNPEVKPEGTKAEEPVKELSLEELRAKVPDVDRSILMGHAEILNKISGEPIDERKILEKYLGIKPVKSTETKPVEPTVETKPVVSGELPVKGKINIGYRFADGSLIAYKGTHGDETFNKLLKEKGISEDDFGQMFVDKKVQGGYIDSKGNFYTDAKKALDAEKIDDSVILKTTGADRNMLDRIANDIDLPLSKDRSENAPQTTPISTVDKTKPPLVEAKPKVVAPQNEVKRDFEFEKSNFTNVMSKIKTDKEAYTTSEAGKAEIRKMLGDIRDFAENRGVEDYRDFTMQALKEAGLPAGKISNMMKLGGHDLSESAVTSALKKDRIAEKGKKYGRDLKKLAEEFTGKREAQINYENMKNTSDKVEDFVKDKDLVDLIEAETSRGLGEDVSPKMITKEISGDVSNEGRTQQTKKSEKDQYIESIQQDLTDKGFNPTSTKSIKEAQLANEISKREADDLIKHLSGDRQKPIISEKKMETQETLLEMLAKNYMGEGLTTGQAIDKAVADGNLTETQANGLKKLYNPRVLNEMYETGGTGRRLTAEERRADVAKGNAFWNQFGVEVVEGQVPQEPGKPLRSAMFEFNFTDGTGKITIDTTLGRTTSISHENMHGYQTLAVGKDKVQLDQLLKDYGWNGDMRDKSFVDAQEKIIKQVQNITPRHPVVQRMVEAWERMANWFHGKGAYSEAQLFRKLATGQIEVARYKTEGSVKFYETLEKPTDSKTDMLEIASRNELSEIAEWQNRMMGQRDTFSKTKTFNRMLTDNKLSLKARRLGTKLLQSAIQTNNYANQQNKDGIYIRPDEKGLYDIAKEHLVDKVPLVRNAILKDPKTWNEGHEFRLLDGNNIKDHTVRNDLASKIVQYSNDIYYGKKEAPALIEGEGLQQAHTRIGKEIGLSDAQIKADWATQLTLDQARKQGYNATVDMFNNLKDIDNGKFVVTDGLSRKQLSDKLGIDAKVKDEGAYQMARDIINTNPEKRMEIATLLADKSQFAERFNPFYHNDTRPTNPSNWVITGTKPTEVDANGNIIKSDRFFTYAESEKEAKLRASEWSDKGFLIEENYNIGKEIADKRYNKLSASQLINLANAGHIPINNVTIKALLEATKSGRFEQHGLNKKYVPGMLGTSKEYEQQVVNFVDESVSASVRRYALDKMRDYIARTDTQLNERIRSNVIGEQDKEGLRLTSEWMHQFYNQVSQSDKSMVDGLRELATTAYIGFKPSFAFMQMLQPIQMALPEAIKEGGGFGTFSKSLGSAWDLAYEIKARQKGETTGKVSEELFNMYDKLDKMKKMGATGIKELTGEAGDIRLHYGSDSYRAWSTFMKVGNMGGAIAEKYTRLQSLAMWYDIGKSKGLQGEKLEKFILNKHDEIMSLWGASGRPVLGQSKELGVNQQKAIKAFTKSFFTFKTYTMANLGQYDRLMRNRQWGALGTKMAVGVGLHGITKMPLMATFYGLYSLLADDDLEYEQIKALDEMNAGLLGRGISSVLPISLQNMFDERTAFVSDAYAETRSKSAEGKIMEAMLGAPYGVPKDMLEGSKAIYDIVKDGIDNDSMMTEDERLRAKKNWSKVLPLAARNVFNGMNMKEDGIQMRGRELVKADDISWGDVVYKWLGFNPSKVANAYELQFLGFPAKWSRINGKLSELKSIRKEISTDKGYTDLERTTELRNVNRLIKEAQAEQSELRRTADYKSAYKQGLINP